jgi:hypothetical protein
VGEACRPAVEIALSSFFQGSMRWEVKNTGFWLVLGAGCAQKMKNDGVINLYVESCDVGFII